MPIFWSFQKTNNRIGEIDLTDPYLYLGECEKKIFQRLKFPKRKGEWFGARLVIKGLVRAVDNRWRTLEFQEIEILNEASGAPYLVFSGGQAIPGKVSLSHSNGYVLCAYSPENIHFGVDLELVEPRSKEFAEDFFTANELDQTQKLSDSERTLFVTVLWSSKESVLKSLTSGLRVDTRSIEVNLPELPIEQNGWINLGLKSCLIKDDSFSLVWRRERDFVLSACIPQGYTKELIRVDL